MRTSWLYLLFVIFCTLHICNSKSISENISEATLAEDGRLNFTQLVIKYGQSVEQYYVVTEDGYILTLFHIFGKKAPVLLLHGLFDSSDTYVMRGNSSLGITLAREGYDVWVGNSRGNQYGRRHVTLDPDKDKEFWDYSFHEVGCYDLPALIDFVCDKTGSDQISTVGHSQGTAAHYILLSSRPEYNEKIKVCIALAPVAFANHINIQISLIADAWPAINPVLEAAGVDEIFQDHKAASNLIKFLCSKGLISYAVCGEGIIFPLAGPDMEELGPKYATGVALAHFPRATSRKTLTHYFQIHLRHKFAQYDYGLENMAKYGTVTPPDYNLTAVTANMALFVGKTDELASIKDVEHLKSFLPNVVHHEVMKPAQWGHLAFVSGKYMPKYLYPSIFKMLKTYN